jgi:primosomal protein N''
MLFRKISRMAATVAATEEELADTFDRMAEQRPAADAERLRAKAAGARNYAARERDLAADLSGRLADQHNRDI